MESISARMPWCDEPDAYRRHGHNFLRGLCCWRLCCHALDWLRWNIRVFSALAASCALIPIIYGLVDIGAATASQFLLPSLGAKSFRAFAVLSMLLGVVAAANRSVANCPATARRDSELAHVGRLANFATSFCRVSYDRADQQRL
jgi:hypothetical protein